MHASIWTFGKNPSRELLIGGVRGFAEERASKSGAFTDDKGHGCFLHGEDILSIHHQFLLRQIVCFIRPGDGEGVRGHKTDGGEVQVCVLTCFEGPRTRHVDCNAACVSGKGFDESF